MFIDWYFYRYKELFNRFLFTKHGLCLLVEKKEDFFDIIQWKHVHFYPDEENPIYLILQLYKDKDILWKLYKQSVRFIFIHYSQRLRLKLSEYIIINEKRLLRKKLLI